METSPQHSVLSSAGAAATSTSAAVSDVRAGLDTQLDTQLDTGLDTQLDTAGHRAGCAETIIANGLVKALQQGRPCHLEQGSCLRI